MVTTISETISGFDFFYCEKSSCRLKTEVCLTRQEADRSAVGYNRVKYEFCRGCSQGAKIKELIDFAGPAKPREPSTGKGKKDAECPFYSTCLDYVTKEGWKSFNCESCVFFKVKPKEKNKASKMDGKNLCEKCSQKPVVNQFSKYCSGCLNSFKKAKKKAPGAPKKKKAGHGRAKPRKAQKTANAAAPEKLCKKCGGNPTIHQNSPYCSGCLHDMKKAKQDCQEATKEPKKEPDKVKSEKDLESNIEGGMIIVYFGQYGSILKEVEKLAEREIRPVEMQIIYMLNNQLKAGA